MKRSFLILWFSVVFAQMNFTGNSEMRIGESKNGFYFNETLINTQLNYGNFNQWLQFEFSDPPELGKSINGLRKLRLEYRSENIELKLGDLYEFWGRGLVLNSRDDQTIDRDTGIRGFSLKYNRDQFSGQFLTGKAEIDLSSPINPDARKHDYTSINNLYGYNLDYKLGNHVFGTTFLQSKENHGYGLYTGIRDTIKLKNQLEGLNYIYTHPAFDFYAEYTKNQSYYFNDTQFEDHKEGRGMYLNLNMYHSLLSMNFEYINYRYGLLDPLNAGNFVDNYGMIQPYQQPPTVQNIHTHVLMNRVLHQTNFNDEVGYKFEVMSSLSDKMEFSGLYVNTSRTKPWVMNTNFQWYGIEDPALFPRSEIAANPFHEVFGEFTYYFMDHQLLLKAGMANMVDITRVDFHTQTDTSSWIDYSLQKSLTFPLNATYSFGKGWSVDLKLETQYLTKSVGTKKTLNGVTVQDTLISLFNYFTEQNEPVEVDFATNHYISLNIGKSPTWAIALSLDRSDVPELNPNETNFTNFLEQILDLETDKNWINVEFMYNITPKIQMTMFYGSLKGGLICTNGICRTIDPFNDGFKMSITAMF